MNWNIIFPTLLFYMGIRGSLLSVKKLLFEMNLSKVEINILIKDRILNIIGSIVGLFRIFTLIQKFIMLKVYNKI